MGYLMPVVRLSVDDSDSPALRSALGVFATRVTIVTMRLHGTDFGPTVNSYSSVSLIAPMVLSSLANSSDWRCPSYFEPCGSKSI
jgi:flavin reductase (DIM6/NTAB) family NADH-FMN oxidoreductase RutF